MTKTQKQAYGTVLIKADHILNFLSSCDQPQRLNEIALTTEISKSTVLKILDTLSSINYVYKDPDTKKFSLGPALVKFGNQSINQMEIKEIAQPYLEKLAESTTETVNLGVLNQNSITFITKIESTNPVALYSRIGRSIPAYCSAMGKAILAEKSDEEIADYLLYNKLIKKTDKTITSKEAFIEDLQNVRERGYAFDNEEHEAEVFCVGASISLGGKNYGAISVSVPNYRMTEVFLQTIIKDVQQCQKDIVNELRIK